MSSWYDFSTSDPVGFFNTDISSSHDFSTSDARLKLHAATLEFIDLVDPGSDEMLGSDTTNEIFLHLLTYGRRRVKRLISQNWTGVMEKLKALEQCFECFEEILKIKDRAAERSRLVSIAKRILEGWQEIENGIGRKQQSLNSWDYMAPVDYPQAVPSPWLFENDWRDKAYEEVLSLKKKYSNALDEAYIDVCRVYSVMDEASGLRILPQKKLLNFLGSTKEDISIMSKEKCYKRVMNIKRLFTEREQRSDLVSICIFQAATRCNQSCPPNWRDEIYGQIRACRKMYSLQMDRNLSFYGMKAKSGTLDEEGKEHHSFTEEALQFLANSRADLAFCTEEYCRGWLDDITLYMKGLQDSLPEMQSMEQSPELGYSQINWRDVAYEQLQSKADRFRYQVYDMYHAYKGIWSQIPEFDEKLKTLEKYLQVVAEMLYEMPRARMSSFMSAYDYFDLVDTTSGCVLECVILIRHLLRGLEEEGAEPSWECNYDLLTPNWVKLLPVVEGH